MFNLTKRKFFVSLSITKKYKKKKKKIVERKRLNFLDKIIALKKQIPRTTIYTVRKKIYLIKEKRKKLHVIQV